MAGAGLLCNNAPPPRDTTWKPRLFPAHLPLQRPEEVRSVRAPHGGLLEQGGSCGEIVRHGDDDGGTRRFVLPMSQQDLASFSGLSREAVVKGLASLRSLNWVKASGREIEILDVTAVTERARQA